MRIFKYPLSFVTTKVTYKIKECEVCYEEKKVKSMCKLPTGQWICRKCYRKSSGIKAHLDAAREVNKINRKRSALTYQESKVLWNIYNKKGMSDEEKKERIKSLKSSVLQNNKLMVLATKGDKKSFKEEFQKLTQKKPKILPGE